MTKDKAYQKENLSLSSLAAASACRATSFPSWSTRGSAWDSRAMCDDGRVEAAKALLVTAPSQSILTVSMDTGFRSQSAFYAAFKEVDRAVAGRLWQGERRIIVRNDLSGAQQAIDSKGRKKIFDPN